MTGYGGFGEIVNILGIFGMATKDLSVCLERIKKYTEYSSFNKGGLILRI